MKVLIGQALLVLGFICGMIYAQYQPNTMIVSLRKEIALERDRNTVLDRALDIVTKNKYKKHDAIWAASQEANRASR